MEEWMSSTRCRVWGTPQWPPVNTVHETELHGLASWKGKVQLPHSTDVVSASGEMVTCKLPSAALPGIGLCV